MSLNPVIKFTALFGLLTTEIAAAMKSQGSAQRPKRATLLAQETLKTVPLSG
jgi:hypothetical protein